MIFTGRANGCMYMSKSISSWLCWLSDVCIAPVYHAFMLHHVEDLELRQQLRSSAALAVPMM
jgi:hypothetical protein